MNVTTRQSGHGIKGEGSSRPVAAAGSGLRILHVEDNHLVASALARYLIFKGWEVDHAIGGEQALGLLEQRGYDVVLLDWNFDQGPDGLDICPQIRARCPEIWIVFLTVRDSESDRLTGLEAGADDYICKQTGVEDIVVRLRELERRLAERR